MKVKWKATRNYFICNFWNMKRIFQSIMTIFNHWAKNIFRKTTMGEMDIIIWLKSDFSVVTRDEVFNVVHKCQLRTEHSGMDATFVYKIVLKCIFLTICIHIIAQDLFYASQILHIFMFFNSVISRIVLSLAFSNILNSTENLVGSSILQVQIWILRMSRIIVNKRWWAQILYPFENVKDYR